MTSVAIVNEKYDICLNRSVGFMCVDVVGRFIFLAGRNDTARQRFELAWVRGFVPKTS